MAKIPTKPRPLDKTPTQTEPEPYPIQGKTPGSREEFRVALALDRLKLGYIYQYGFMGGASLPGGQIIDFWVYTVPLPTPVYVQGKYWHGSSKRTDDRLKQSRVNRAMKGQVNLPVEIWDYEIPTMDRAYQVCKERLG